MNALTRVAIKRCKRLHPEWTDQHILDNIRSLTDLAGIYADQVAIQDVQDVIAGMRESRPGEMFHWN